jgi:hypothetical protein
MAIENQKTLANGGACASVTSRDWLANEDVSAFIEAFNFTVIDHCYGENPVEGVAWQKGGGEQLRVTGMTGRQVIRALASLAICYGILPANAKHTDEG